MRDDGILERAYLILRNVFVFANVFGNLNIEYSYDESIMYDTSAESRNFVIFRKGDAYDVTIPNLPKQIRS